MIKNDVIALITARYPGDRARLFRGLVRFLCRLMNADVDFVPYKWPSDIVPLGVCCTRCHHVFYVRANLYNEEQTQCPECHREYTVWTDGTIARHVPKGETNDTD